MKWLLSEYMTNGRCVACVTGISVCDALCERGTEVKGENKGRGAAGGVARGRDRVLEKKNEYSKYGMEATGVSFISRIIRRK